VLIVLVIAGSSALTRLAGRICRLPLTATACPPMDADDQRILGNLNRRGYAATFFQLPALRRDGRFPTNIEPWPQSVLADQERLRDQCPGWAPPIG
jgi:hypothetical protein